MSHGRTLALAEGAEYFVWTEGPLLGVCHYPIMSRKPAKQG
jgi:hypothetical protein